MRLLFAVILVMTVFSGCKEWGKAPADDILPSFSPVLNPGKEWMLFHQLYVVQVPDHHNLYLIRRVPFSERQTHFFLMGIPYALTARCKNWERAVLPRGTIPITGLPTFPATLPVRSFLHL